MSDMSDEITIPCRFCGEPTRMLGTKLCDPCWEIKRLIDARPAVVKTILSQREELREAFEAGFYSACKYDTRHLSDEQRKSVQNAEWMKHQWKLTV